MQPDLPTLQEGELYVVQHGELKHLERPPDDLPRVPISKAARERLLETAPPLPQSAGRLPARRGAGRKRADRARRGQQRGRAGCGGLLRCHGGGTSVVTEAERQRREA